MLKLVFYLTSLESEVSHTYCMPNLRSHPEVTSFWFYDHTAMKATSFVPRELFVKGASIQPVWMLKVKVNMFVFVHFQVCFHGGCSNNLHNNEHRLDLPEHNLKLLLTVKEQTVCWARLWSQPLWILQPERLSSLGCSSQIKSFCSPQNNLTFLC